MAERLRRRVGVQLSWTLGCGSGVSSAARLDATALAKSIQSDMGRGKRSELDSNQVELRALHFTACGYSNNQQGRFAFNARATFDPLLRH